jgi:PKHD-type hydroxylase
MALIKPFRFVPNVKRKPLNYDFVDYMWFSNCFSAAEVAKIMSLWSNEKAEEAEVNLAGDEISRDDLRKSDLMFLEPGPDTDWIYDRLGQAVLQANSNRFKFDIKGFQTQLQLARYSDGGFFDWHLDFGAGDISDRKLSITVQLSKPEDYEGGELQFMINQNVIDASRDQGTAVIFPSFGMHRVMPVTKGERFSIVGWISGPPYR